MKKKEVYTISRRNWQKAQRVADDAIKDIPEHKNRIRAHARAAALHREIKWLAEKKVIDVERKGQKIIYMDTVNLGSKRYPDFCRDFYELSYSGNERKVNVWFIYG